VGENAALEDDSWLPHLVNEDAKMNLKAKWSLNMKTNGLQRFGAVTAIAIVFVLSLSAHAQDAGGTLYKAKCAMCHGADGSKIAGHDLQGGATQRMSDADISAIITNGKGKMPASKSLKPDEVTALAAYIRTLKK
jgi:cytochrome c6